MSNLAVLLEPFPMRNSLGVHAWIAERVCAMLHSSENRNCTIGDMRVICNEPTMTHLVGVTPSARPYLIQPSAKAQAGFAALIADWHTQGIKTWAAIQAGSAEHEALYESVLRSALEAYPFSIIAYWGTNETLRTAAKRLGIPVLWAEYGPLRPPFPTHFCLDLEGVNGAASVRRTLELSGEAELTAFPSMALQILLGKASAYEMALQLPPEAVRADFARLMLFVKGHRRVVLLTLQLADDANILAFGNGWTCFAMVEAVLEAQSDPDTVFILRPHPGEALSFHNFAAGDAVRALVEPYPNVLIFDAPGADAYLACLSVASEIVCINSSVGFEASLLGKSVRVLGEASYMPLSNTSHDLRASPARLSEQSITNLMEEYYIPEGRFWTLSCWRDAAAAALPQCIAYPGLLPHLPTLPARVLGEIYDAGDGLLLVVGIGTLNVHPLQGTGCLDQMWIDSSTSSEKVTIRGWGSDLRTGGMLAGFIITTGEHSIWCSTTQHRADVAMHYGDASKLATGFAICVARSDFASAWQKPVRVIGVTVAGLCYRLSPAWAFNSDIGRFDPMIP